MSSFRSTIVPIGVDEREAKLVAELLVNHLIEKKIISANKTDCILSESLGHPPSDNFQLVMEKPYSSTLDLLINGVEVNTERQVFYSDGIDSISCPNCGGELIETNWEDAMGNWHTKTDSDNITCPKCNKRFSITEVHFKPTWAFGEVGFSFWNWGAPFNESFIEEVEQVIGYNVKAVYGKI